MTTLTCRSRMLARLVVSGVLVVSAPAMGQAGRDGFRAPRMTGRQLQPEFLRRDMRLFAEQLGLDAAQKGIVESLLRDYEASFGLAAERMRHRLAEVLPRQGHAARDARRQALRSRLVELGTILQQLRAAGDTRPETLARFEDELRLIREELAELRPGLPGADELADIRAWVEQLSGDWRTERTSMRAAVVDGTRAVLNDAQLARWPSFQRSLRRQKALPMGRLAGESVDLDILLRQIGVKPERIPGLPDTLARYEVELDRALVARDDRLEDARARTMLAMMSRDLEGAVQIANEEAQLREAVRVVNEQYVAALGRLLGGERALDFDQAWRLRAYPGVYEPTPTARAFSTALGLGDLDVQQREVVSLMHELYLEELEPRNAELAAAVRRQERLDIQRRLRRWSGDRADHRADPRPEAERRRAELGDRFRAQLEMVLTPEQAAQLPPPGELDDAPARRGAERPFDRDGDGELSEAEREAAQRQFRPRLRRDRGGSGS